MQEGAEDAGGQQPRQIAVRHIGRTYLGADKASPEPRNLYHVGFYACRAPGKHNRTLDGAIIGL
jgi:hypothetical protein